MARKIAKRGTCCQCAVEDVELTVEHVFPESWYPDDHPQSEMLKAPSCRPCNQRLGESEHRVQLALAMMLRPDPRTATMWARVLRSVDGSGARDERDRGAREKRGARFMAGVSIRDPGETKGALWTSRAHPVGNFVTESGIRFRAQLTAEVPWDDLEAVAIKLLRGCYFEQTGTALPASSNCWARAFDEDPGETWEAVQRLPGALRRGAFPFEYTLVIDHRKPAPAAATIVLWDAFRLFVAGGLPETRPGA